MKRGIIYGLIIVGLLALWWGLHNRDKRIDQSIAAPSLGPDDRAKIVLDNANHTVTRVDDTGIHKTFLNPHGPVSITEKKNGSVVLAQRTYGTIHEPNIGASLGSDLKFRAALGVSLFYVQRWEMGGGLLVNPSQLKDLRLYGAVSYNVYSNWLISAGVDNHKAIQLIASVRF